jgi:type IV pilus assembly protein PilC
MAGIDLTKARYTLERETAEKKSGLFDLLNKDISIFKRGLNDKKRERFYSELSILLSAGVDIKTALELVVEQQGKEADKEIFRKILEAIINGSGLCDAMKASGKFSTYEEYSVRIGEESGKLNEVLQEQAAYYGRTIKQKRQIVNALSYPIVVLCTAVGTVIFMMNFIVPMFADVFKRFGGDLPWITKIVVSVSEGLSTYIGWIFLLLIAGTAFIFSQRRKEWFKRFSANLLLKIPVFGPLIRKIYLARLCSSMNLLLSAHTPLVHALELVSSMVDFPPISDSLETSKKEIMKGNSLYQALSKHSIYPSQFVSLVKVAEEVNQMDMIFGKLSKQYSDEVEHQTEMLRSLIEPLLIIFIGAFVAFILVAMYLPLFKLGTTIH